MTSSEHSELEFRGQNAGFRLSVSFMRSEKRPKWNPITETVLYDIDTSPQDFVKLPVDFQISDQTIPSRLPEVETTTPSGKIKILLWSLLGSFTYK